MKKIAVKQVIVILAYILIGICILFKMKQPPKSQFEKTVHKVDDINAYEEIDANEERYGISEISELDEDIFHTIKIEGYIDSECNKKIVLADENNYFIINVFDDKKMSQDYEPINGIERIYFFCYFPKESIISGTYRIGILEEKNNRNSIIWVDKNIQI